MRPAVLRARSVYLILFALKGVGCYSVPQLAGIPEDYHKEILPYKDAERAVLVKVWLYICSLGPLDHMGTTVTSEVYIRLSWHDSRLSGLLPFNSMRLKLNSFVIQSTKEDKSTNYCNTRTQN